MAGPESSAGSARRGSDGVSGRVAPRVSFGCWTRHGNSVVDVVVGDGCTGDSRVELVLELLLGVAVEVEVVGLL